MRLTRPGASAQTVRGIILSDVARTFRSASPDPIEFRLRADEEAIPRDRGTGERELAKAVLRELLVGVARLHDERIAFLAEKEDVAAIDPRRCRKSVADAAHARFVQLASRLQLVH